MIHIMRLIVMKDMILVIPFDREWSVFAGLGWNDNKAVAKAHGDLRADASSLAKGGATSAGAPRLRSRLAGPQGLAGASRGRHPSVQGTKEPRVLQFDCIERHEGKTAQLHRRSG